MKTRLWPALMVGTAALCSATIGFAQQVSTISTRFTITAAGQASPILNLSQSQATCSVQLDSAGVGLTLVPQATSDATPSASSGWATATSINAGSISTAQAAPYTGGIANTGLSGFRVLATALSSGTVSGTITCSQAQTGATVTGTVTAVVSPIPLPVSISPVPLPVNVQYSPIPTNTAATAITTSGLGAGGQNPVTIYDANGVNAADVDAQGHLRTLLCNPGQTACASVNNQNALLAGFYDTTSLDTLALNAANTVLYAPALPANSFGLISLHVVTLNGSGATLTVEGVVRQEGTYGPLTLRSDAGVVATNGQITADGFYRANVAGYSNFRVRVSTTGSVQTASIYSDISNNSSFPILGNVTVSSTGVVSVTTPSPTQTAASTAQTVSVCDPTTSLRCATVSAGGVVSVTTPVPLATAASTATQVTNCDLTTVNQCNKVDSNGSAQVQLFSGATGPASIAATTSDAQTIGSAVATKTAAYCYNGTNFDRCRKDTYANGPLWVTPGGGKLFVLTSASATTCTTLGTGVGRLVQIYNTGPATTVFPIFYDDTVCTTAANVRFGDFTTVTIGTGQVITFNIPLATGLSYKLSGALSATQNLVITTYGIGF